MAVVIHSCSIMSFAEAPYIFDKNAVLAGTSKNFLSRLQLVQNMSDFKKEKVNQCDSPPEGVAVVTYCSTH